MAPTDRESITPLPGQLVFRFMHAEHDPAERLAPGQTNGLTGRAKEARPGKHPARGTKSGKGGTRDG